MKELCSCVPRVTKKGCRLLVPLLLLLYSAKGLAQNAASVIQLPKGPRTYAEALNIIGEQLHVWPGYHPDCPELFDTCRAYGQMTFGKFFEPLKARGLTYTFIFTVRHDHSKPAIMLSISRAKPLPPKPVKPRTFVDRKSVV